MSEWTNENGEPIRIESAGDFIMKQSASATGFRRDTWKCPVCGHTEETLRNCEMHTYCSYDAAGEMVSTGWLCPVCTVEAIKRLGIPQMEKLTDE